MAEEEWQDCGENQQQVKTQSITHVVLPGDG
jgi:hypothetical protein